MTTAFWLNQMLKFILLWGVQYGTGQLVHHHGVKVNYTRKMNHFSLFFLPMVLDQVFVYNKSIGLFAIGCVLGVFSLAIYMEPVRKRVKIIQRMFESFDRPEDRPHTLAWLSTQIAAGFLVVIPAVMFFAKAGYLNLILVPILIAGIGDGLAEPVGVRFGRYTYQTRALFSKRRYVRTLEGSSCLLMTSIVVIVCYQHAFTSREFMAALIAIPIIMTLAEAYSPHTWDQPFLFITGYGSLYLIKWHPFFQ